MCTRVTQNSDPACAWACAGAAVLEAIMMGQAPSEAVAGTVRELRRGEEVSGETLEVVVGRGGGRGGVVESQASQR